MNILPITGCQTFTTEPIPKVTLCLNYKFASMPFHEIEDDLWKSIEPYLPPQKPSTGRPRADLRKLMNGI